MYLFQKVVVVMIRTHVSKTIYVSEKQNKNFKYIINNITIMYIIHIYNIIITTIIIIIFIIIILYITTVHLKY